MYLLRKPILAVSGSAKVRAATVGMPLTRSVVQRFVAGETTADAVAAVAALRSDGLLATLDHLGENTTSAAQADATVAAYLEVLEALDGAGLAAGTEVSVKLSAVGQSLPDRGADIALAQAGRIADAAGAVGARMTVDIEDHTTIDSTLGIVAALRAPHPDVGVAIQAMLRRTPGDLAGLVGPGSRVRLVKGAYDEPAAAAYQGPAEVDLAYVRNLKTLMAGDGYPMVGSHDPRMIEIADRLAREYGRGLDTFEHQFLYGIRTDAQRSLAAAGRTVRVYVPYGTDWYGYFTRRLAERPANLTFFLRALISRN